MKRCTAICMAVLLLFFAFGCSQGQRESGVENDSRPPDFKISKDQMDAVTQRFDQLLKRVTFRGSVLCASNGEIIYEKGMGSADREKKTNNTPQTVYYIGSVTKQFTAAAVLLLQEENKLSTADTIDRYFPDYRYGGKITVRQLLNMSAGLKDVFNDADTGETYNVTQLEEMGLGFSDENSTRENKDEALRFILSNELEFEPGSSWSYSNSAYILLGHIIEKASGESYEDFVTGHILKPLQLDSTCFLPPENTAKPYQGKYEHEWCMYPGVFFSAGEMLSTVEDLYTWAQALLGGKILDKTSLEEMLADYGSGYGYGLFIDESGYAHSGRLYAYQAGLAMSAQGGMVSAALSNYGDCDPYRVCLQMPAEILKIIDPGAAAGN